MEELLGYVDVFEVDFSTIPMESRYIGVIVEPRRHKMLELILRNFVYMMKGWSLLIYHSDDNREYVEKILGENHRARLVRMSEGNIDIDDYNRLLMSKEFYETVGGEKILVFQCDSFIRKRCIDRFMEYDYVGAPWAPNTISKDRYLEVEIDRVGVREKHKIVVGNGGISLRTPSVMMRILSLPYLEGWKKKVNEDIFFAIGMECVTDCKRCPMEVSMTFSVETIFYHDPFAWHKAYAYWSGPQWEILKSITPI
jgi:hypothetical protein